MGHGHPPFRPSGERPIGSGGLHISTEMLNEGVGNFQQRTIHERSADELNANGNTLMHVTCWDRN